MAFIVVGFSLFILVGGCFGIRSGENYDHDKFFPHEKYREYQDLEPDIDFSSPLNKAVKKYKKTEKEAAEKRPAVRSEPSPDADEKIEKEKRNWNWPWV